MKKLLVVPFVAAIALSVSVNCFAETALTYVDTVVYMSDYERTLYEVLDEVAEKAKADMEKYNGNIPTYVEGVDKVDNSSIQQPNGGKTLKDVIRRK
ncbi:MAG: hypothetical protein J1F63_07510 [Oscillospiraceae bacterium]|nr:hypothetical protein [Oscillospiraceae bacterium]